MTSTEASPGTGGPKTRRGQASRDRLVDAAVESVLDHGIHQMRVDEVLAAAGSSKSQMYHYFSDRDALVEAVVVKRCEEFLGQLGPTLGGVRTLADLAVVLRGFADNYATHLQGCPVGTLASELVSGPEPARRVTVDAFAAWEGYLAGALERIQANGELGDDADPGDLALGLLAAMEGGMFLGQVWGDARPLRVALDAVIAHLEAQRRQ